ncbi:MAG: helix-turn-helix domain-containing protein [Brasilonema sp.]
MSEKDVVTAKLLPDGTVVQIFPDGSTQPLPGQTDWERIKAMTEEEIESAALSDSDNPPLTEKELERFKPVPNLKQIRQQLQMTQAEFAESFSLPLGTIRDWEQGAKQPDSAAKILLQVIAKNPQAVLQALRD